MNEHEIFQIAQERVISQKVLESRKHRRRRFIFNVLFCLIVNVPIGSLFWLANDLIAQGAMSAVDWGQWYGGADFLLVVPIVSTIWLIWSFVNTYFLADRREVNLELSKVKPIEEEMRKIQDHEEPEKAKRGVARIGDDGEIVYEEPKRKHSEKNIES